MNIFEAVSIGNLTRLRELIANGVNVNEPDANTKQTPLQIAVEFNNDNSLEIVKELLGNEADIHANATLFLPPVLYIAAQFSNNPLIIRELIEKEADVNECYGLTNQTPLHYAVKYNDNPEITKELLKNSANINAEDINKKKPIHAASEVSSNPEILGVLIETGRAHINAVDLSGKTPLHYAVKSHNKLGIIQKLIANGAKIKAVDNSGNTPLHIASMYNSDPERIQELITNGAEVNAVDAELSTPLHATDWNTNTRAIAIALADNGANIYAKNADGNTPLDLSNVIKGALRHHTDHITAGERLQELTLELAIDHIDDEGNKSNALEIVLLNHYELKSANQARNNSNIKKNVNPQQNNEQQQFEAMVNPIDTHKKRKLKSSRQNAPNKIKRSSMRI